MATLFDTLWADGVFVYGTLRGSSPSYRLIQDLVDDVDSGYFVTGTLYNCGAYPGLVIGVGDHIRGEVLRSTRLHELLNSTDKLEGTDFRRRLSWAHPVSPDQAKVLVWVYELAGDTSGLTRCPGGVWLASQENKRCAS